MSPCSSRWGSGPRGHAGKPAASPHRCFARQRRCCPGGSGLVSQVAKWACGAAGNSGGGASHALAADGLFPGACPSSADNHSLTGDSQYDCTSCLMR